MEVEEVTKKSSNTKNNTVHGKSVDPYSAFEIRFCKVMCDPSKRSIPLDLNNEQLKSLYNGISPIIETSIFAEMEHVMTAIRTSFDAVIDRVGDDIELKSYMNNDKNFKRIITHVVTNYQSLQEQRINILMIHNMAYQRLEDKLFGETFVVDKGFQKAYQLHNELIQSFHHCYHHLLFEGTMLDTDEEVEVKVIEPIVQRYAVKIRRMLEGGENA
ncbi:hypothetical protein ACS127_03945 [Amphibacillus sp. Q70]|uniref:hypothetical protein n=1 Tax=Bacillaceae TaxID=186817 RepID=UPI0008264B6B|nr:hypothetical protein [Gracilibacillus timonensis]